ncbi:MAG: DUF3138 family protein [Anaeromyxobacteraceae bacterium]
MRILKLTTLMLSLAASTARAEAGLTQEQEQDLNRTKLKVEAIEDQTEKSGLKGFKFSAYMDPTYIYNVNKERGTFQFLTPIAKEPYAYDNGYFSTLALDVQKETDSGTRFHLTLYPTRGGGDVTGERSIVHEASVWVPVGDYKVFAGQLPDWSGYEYYAPNMYKSITHNLLFDFTLPASYTGVGVEVPAGKWDFKLMLANMNQSVRNVGEHIPMFVFRGDYAGGEFWGLGMAGSAGYKTNYRAADDGTGDPALDGKDSLYLSYELDGWYTRGDVTLNAHVGFGRQDKAAITADPDTGKLRPATWVGASVLAAYKTSIQTELALRADFIWNEKNGGGLLDYNFSDAVNGIGPGADAEKGANRYAVTATYSYYVNANVTWKLEGRYDGATQEVFANKDALVGGDNPKFKKNNVVAGTALVFYF